MNAEEFMAKWGEDDIIFYNADMLSQRGISPKYKNYLSKYGLPESAAPYLNFETINIENMSFLFDDYFYLGFTGNGDWICIKNSSGKILIVDHEIYSEDGEDSEEDEEGNNETDESTETDDDEEFEGIILMNTSLETLYECLLAYKEFVNKHIPENSAEYRKELGILEKTLTQIDTHAMNVDGFWRNAICDLLWS